eukprot:8500376-Alexandrium_andersonii.AAC.1
MQPPANRTNSRPRTAATCKCSRRGNCKPPEAQQWGAAAEGSAPRGGGEGGQPTSSGRDAQ